MSAQTTREAVAMAAPPDKRTLRREWTALIAGIIIALVAVSPPVDELVDQAFSAHMVQHMVMIVVVAPLLAIAWPLILSPWRTTRFVALLNLLARPAPALVLSLSTGALWFWHIPTLYGGALENALVHTLQHLIFIGGFVLFWRPLINDRLGGGHLQSNELRVLYLSIGMVAHGLLGAYITFSGELLYPHYADTTPGGRTPLADQHLGGAIMWIVASLAMVAAALATLREES